MIFLAENYKTREELEIAVKNECGLTVDKKEDTIEGTTEELKNLQLSKDCKFWGLSVIETDSEENEVVKNEIPDRGEVYKSGINLE